MGAMEQDRLTESSRSINDLWMKSVFGIPECEEVKEFHISGVEIEKALKPKWKV